MQDGLQNRARVFFHHPFWLLSMGIWTWFTASIRATHSLRLAAQIAMQKLFFQVENRVFHCLSKLQQGCTRDLHLFVEEEEKAASALTRALSEAWKNRLLKGSRFNSSWDKQRNPSGARQESFKWLPMHAVCEMTGRKLGKALMLLSGKWELDYFYRGKQPADWHDKSFFLI